MQSSNEMPEHLNEWDAEVERYEFNQDDEATVATAELPEELSLHKLMAETDPRFDEQLGEWEEYIWANWLFLALEQSCHDGMLLPTEQRALRLVTCPEKTLSKLRFFFEFCPPHVKSYLALEWYWLMRIDRARRTGNPEWRPTRTKAHDIFKIPGFS